MHATKTILALALLGVTALGTQRWKEAEPVSLKEEQAALMYNRTEDEAVVVFSAEIEAKLQSLAIHDPAGRLVFSLETRAELGFDVSGIELETGERTLLATCLAYPSGRYRMVGRTVDGTLVQGGAVLTHALVRPPHLTLPRAGDRSVSADSVSVRWHADASAQGYTITLEQDDNDGLSVDLPPGSDSFSVPPGLLIPGLETWVEVSAFGPNGNRSASEVAFVPQ